MFKATAETECPKCIQIQAQSPQALLLEPSRVSESLGDIGLGAVGVEGGEVGGEIPEDSDKGYPNCHG